MSVVAVETPSSHAQSNVPSASAVAAGKRINAADDVPPPPPVITTPADRWPRPYFLSDNLRRVEPYHYTYNTYCKERWRGRSLIDIYESEFRDRPKEYYVSLQPSVSSVSIIH